MPEKCNACKYYFAECNLHVICEVIKIMAKEFCERKCNF